MEDKKNETSIKEGEVHAKGVYGVKAKEKTVQVKEDSIFGLISNEAGDIDMAVCHAAAILHDDGVVEENKVLSDGFKGTAEKRRCGMNIIHSHTDVPDGNRRRGR